jgi:hypothetical protein
MNERISRLQPLGEFSQPSPPKTPSWLKWLLRWLIFIHQPMHHRSATGWQIGAIVPAVRTREYSLLSGGRMGMEY